jgi:RNA polymerase sigma-70 factor (ECF subfamily)
MSPTPSPSVAEWDSVLEQAKAGSSAAKGQLLQAYRPYLLAIAHQEIDNNLVCKVSPADLVQDTFLAALRNFIGFKGMSLPELHRWLRQMLLREVGFQRRYYATQCRAVNREMPLDSVLCPEGEVQHLTVLGPSPGEQAQAKEERLLLREALRRLPGEYRQVLLLRNGREEYSFAEIGTLMGRSEDAARKLWRRALERLRRAMGIKP